MATGMDKSGFNYEVAMCLDEVTYEAPRKEGHPSLPPYFEVELESKGAPRESVERLANIKADDLPAICGGLIQVIWKFHQQLGRPEFDSETQVIVDLARDSLRNKYGFSPSCRDGTSGVEAARESLRKLEQNPTSRVPQKK